MKFIEENDCLDAWNSFSELIIKEGECFNVITKVENPCSTFDSWYSRHCPKTINAGASTLREVEETIFPARLYERSTDRADLYRRYMHVHERAKRIHSRTRKSWGTYFERMIGFGPSATNQLELAIQGMRSWTKNHKAAIAIHVSSPELDGITKITGNPCLQYIEVICPSRTEVGLVAVYRNHDAFARVFGNFIGLGQLLSFIAAESERQATGLLCHSVHGYNSATKEKLRDLMNSGR